MECLRCGKEMKVDDVYITHDMHNTWYKCECGRKWLHDQYQQNEFYYWSDRKQEYVKYRGKKTWIK